jgi:anti-sigma factor RsiW
MRPHAPKTAALSAYEAGALSPPRRAQVEKHLSSCDTCQGELARIRLWSRESAKIRAQKAVPVDFSRMELALAREAKAQAQTAASERSSRKLAPMLLPLAAAAAALLTLGLGRLIEPGQSPAAAPLVAVHEEAPADVDAVVTLVAGEASLRGTGPLTAGARLATPTVVDVRDGTAHVAVAGEVAVAALAESTVALASSDEATIELSLVRGTVAVRSEVPAERGFHSERRVVVLAAGYVIEADVAVFEVDLPLEGPAAVEVSVHEGRVHVTGRGEDVELEGPAHFAPPSRVGALEAGSVRAPRLGDPTLAERGVLARIDRPGVSRWALEDGTEVSGGPLAALIPPGPLHLVAIDDLGRRSLLDYVATDEGLVDEGAPLTPTAPTVAGYLDPDVISAAIDRERLRRCYNLALRVRPDLGAARLSVRVTLSARGEVVRTRIEGSDVPDSVQACVAAETATWSFPPPGGPMSFVAPLSFSAIGH